MSAVFKRELNAYFTSTTGYIFMAVFLAISGTMVWLLNIFSLTSSVANYFFIMMFFFVILIPILTMRLLSDEKRSRTDQLLLTSPVSLFGIVAGKFFAAFALFEITFAISLLNLIPVANHATAGLDAAQVLSNFIGVSFLAAALIALGIFISSLTESQFIAAIASITAILATLIIGIFSSSITNDFLRNAVKWVSVLDRYANFRYGIFDFSSVLYYVSIAFIFMFLTVRVLERRRWA